MSDERTEAPTDPRIEGLAKLFRPLLALMGARCIEGDDATLAEHAVAYCDSAGVGGVDHSRAGLDLDAIEKRANEATAGPWECTWEERAANDGTGHAYFLHHVQVANEADHDDAGEMVVAADEMDHEPRRTDFRPDLVFIAHAREDVPALVAEVRRLRAAGDLLEPPQADAGVYGQEPAELQPDVAAAVEAFRLRAMKEPLGVDVSDYGDEWVAGFLRGQVNALEEVGPVIAEALRAGAVGVPLRAPNDEETT